MAVPEIQQATSLIHRYSHILLLVPEKPSLDAFASMTALFIALTTQAEEMTTALESSSQEPSLLSPTQTKKVVDAVSPSHVPPALQFLPGSSQTTMRPKRKPDVVLDIAGPQAISEVWQEPLSGGVRLHVAFAEGVTITKDRLETLVRPLPYDLAVILGAADLEELGNTFSAHTDFFYNTPIINIDHRAKNEHFGTVNLVDITASSIAEVTHDLIAHLSPQPITADIATCLYAGIVAATNSFQKPSTSPQSFHTAAKLMEAGADKESVIQHVVKTKPLHLLKLLGRLYARLRYDEHGQLFWSILRPIDFQESGASPDTIPDAMRELTANIAGFNAAFALYQHDNRFDLYLLLGKGLASRSAEIQAQLSARRQNGALMLTINTSSLETAEKAALEHVRSILP